MSIAERSRQRRAGDPTLAKPLRLTSDIRTQDAYVVSCDTHSKSQLAVERVVHLAPIGRFYHIYDENH
jgi:hypothetical protein